LGFGPDQQPLFDPIALAADGGFATAPETHVRLALGPAGSLWTANKNGTQLYGFHPEFSEPDLHITATDIRHRTAYRTGGRLTVTDATVKPGVDILLQAGAGIGLGTGFRVQRGGGLLIRTDP
jgi:hypothetical protein